MNKFLVSALAVFTCVCIGTAQSATTNHRMELAGSHWHSDLGTAQSVAEQSGKPLLVFDMIGRLDEKWC